MLEVAAVVLVAAISTSFVTDLAGSAMKMMPRRRGAKVKDGHVIEAAH